ncbi:hypothetical protein K438DRAFT_1773310 [Mycena galopus ATCC 62051]|nr:hypothetical protein K438DRAFT_1773310 [Mycena galopus ATCC 62051]
MVCEFHSSQSYCTQAHAVRACLVVAVASAAWPSSTTLLRVEKHRTYLSTSRRRKQRGIDEQSGGGAFASAVWCRRGQRDRDLVVRGRTGCCDQKRRVSSTCAAVGEQVVAAVELVRHARGLRWQWKQRSRSKSPKLLTPSRYGIVAGLFRGCGVVGYAPVMSQMPCAIVKAKRSRGIEGKVTCVAIEGVSVASRPRKWYRTNWKHDWYSPWPKSVPIEAPESRTIITDLQQTVLAFPGSKTGQLRCLSGRIHAGNVEGGVCKI